MNVIKQCAGRGRKREGSAVGGHVAELPPPRYCKHASECGPAAELCLCVDSMLHGQVAQLTHLIGPSRSGRTVLPINGAHGGVTFLRRTPPPHNSLSPMLLFYTHCPDLQNA
uniref:Uncharacterized protein n=1 Tax=Paramormyrops kingsleyae TaxID=1676925 RepID=A0A3B3R5Q7_9TELE